MNRIVVIEDDPAIRRGLAHNLRAQSYEVLKAATGTEGYRLVRDEQPDLVILDLMLPGMNGNDVCRRLRNDGLVTPVLMLTAQSLERDRVNGFDSIALTKLDVLDPLAEIKVCVGYKHDGRVTGYATVVGFFGHAAGESNADLEALIGSARAFAGPGLLLPAKNGDLFRWCLERGLKVVQPMRVREVGVYPAQAAIAGPDSALSEREHHRIHINRDGAGPGKSLEQPLADRSRAAREVEGDELVGQ